MWVRRKEEECPHILRSLLRGGPSGLRNMCAKGAALLLAFNIHCKPQVSSHRNQKSKEDADDEFVLLSSVKGLEYSPVMTRPQNMSFVDTIIQCSLMPTRMLQAEASQSSFSARTRFVTKHQEPFLIQTALCPPLPKVSLTMEAAQRILTIFPSPTTSIASRFTNTPNAQNKHSKPQYNNLRTALVVRGSLSSAGSMI